ncbi:hypothetical protein NLI96_g11631 [Meripilus lineatus]|uniref:BTB domain-containing protein n=1 Tax=Meripilus lineatus TaxID=2056292 RepID=A0AAD5URF1_9APHY|nr:hypothetical protein NLI96_g11631 [Physisporinus lineatus]
MSTTQSNFLAPGIGPARRSSATSSFAHLTGGSDETMRHWSYTAFEWIIRDVHKLKEYIESTDTSFNSESPLAGSPSANDFDILKESPTLGDGKFKLEIAKTSPPSDASAPSDEPSNNPQPPTLSLFVTSVVLEYAHPEYEMYTSMFAAIKCQEDRAGERGARAEWAWEFWQNDWVFREDSEVWECPLPPLSVLLENRRIKETDSFVICIQIHSPIGPFFPQQPFATYVPRDLLSGLEASLDNANTGDVRFVCLERKEPEVEVEITTESPNTEIPPNRRSSAASVLSSSSQALARKRIIYAHSDILKRRSEYFATMLESSFAENSASGGLHERKLYTIVVEEADFVTIYWLLKWVYANWLLFKEHDDPKLAVEGVGAGWSAKTLGSRGRGDEWEWKPFTKGNFDLPWDGSDTRSIASSEGVPAVSGAPRPPAIKTKKSFSGGAGQVSTARTPSAARPRVPSTSGSKPPTSPVRPPPSPTRKSTSGPSNTSNSTTLAIPTSGGAPPLPLSVNPPPTISPTTTTFPNANPHFPISPRQQRQRTRTGLTSNSDPHPHPTSPPPPASALSMYQIAHRYAMPGLAALALEHMMSTITPQSSFALLLATSAWDEMHTLVEDYVVDKWEDVSVSGEFEQCCQEVAGGEWGPEGGKTMMALFRRLRSPSSLGFSRA